MDYSRAELLLLLLVGLLSSHVPVVLSAPADFVCNDRVRRERSNLTELELAMDRQNCSDMLPSPLQLPCIKIHKSVWERKTLQQKCVEVVGALKVLQDGVKGVKSQSSLSCQTPLLEKLEHRLRNDILIVKRFPKQGNTTVVWESAAQADCPNQPSQSLRAVLQRYQKLLQGKLESLIADLQSDMCPGLRR